MRYPIPLALVVGEPTYGPCMHDETALEWGGVRIDLAHVHPSTRGPMIREARAWMAQGQRPPILTIRDNGVDVSEQPDLWPARVRNYRGLGRYEWVGAGYPGHPG